ncbi:hypothetical protein COY62_02340 [bacterium (Candidatus Howlettbacteria) CG_4_10_14_0_8_um_filter_40_9]|nr:MAG: hypothetical protein COY62_02340 [bacterium (Candidatus Howlettbacteria) CG_4_10_14_0_8_um_filter_40_9]
MNKDFEKCLKNRRIVKQDFTDSLILPELEDSRSDLLRAQKTFDEPDYKWATIQAYYAMFHAARALLFSKGYREKSHVCLKYAIQALYVDEGLLDQRYVEQFDVTMLLRETADYKRDFSKQGAEVAFNSAKDFLAKTEEILGS